MIGCCSAKQGNVKTTISCHEVTNTQYGVAPKTTYALKCELFFLIDKEYLQQIQRYTLIYD